MILILPILLGFEGCKSGAVQYMPDAPEQQARISEAIRAVDAVPSMPAPSPETVRALSMARQELHSCGESLDTYSRRFQDLSSKYAKLEVENKSLSVDAAKWKGLMWAVALAAAAMLILGSLYVAIRLKLFG